MLAPFCYLGEPFIVHGHQCIWYCFLFNFLGESLLLFLSRDAVVPCSLALGPRRSIHFFPYLRGEIPENNQCFRPMAVFLPLLLKIYLFLFSLPPNLPTDPFHSPLHYYVLSRNLFFRKECLSPIPAHDLIGVTDVSRFFFLIFSTGPFWCMYPISFPTSAFKPAPLLFSKV